MVIAIYIVNKNSNTITLKLSVKIIIF